jgi:hypothetical protein
MDSVEAPARAGPRPFSACLPAAQRMGSVACGCSAPQGGLREAIGWRATAVRRAGAAGFGGCQGRTSAMTTARTLSASISVLRAPPCRRRERSTTPTPASTSRLSACAEGGRRARRLGGRVTDSRRGGESAPSQGCGWGARLVAADAEPGGPQSAARRGWSRAGRTLHGLVELEQQPRGNRRRRRSKACQGLVSMRIRKGESAAACERQGSWHAHLPIQSQEFGHGRQVAESAP